MLEENFTSGIDMLDKKLNIKEDELYSPDDYYCGDAVFNCDADSYFKSIKGKKPYVKYNTYVGNSETGQKIRNYALKNPKRNIILKDSSTGHMIYFRRSRKWQET